METIRVFALNAGAWPAQLEDPAEARDRYHLIALNEARIANEAHGRTVTAPARRLLDRVRAAIGLATAEPACTTCAA